MKADNYTDYYILWDLFTMFYRLMNKYRTMELKQYNISRSQVMMLWLIQGLGDKASVTEISRHAYLKSHGISAILKRMEKNSLLVRNTTPANKTSIFRLTEKGLQAYHASAKMESIEKVMMSLTKQHRKQLKSFLETLLNSVKKEIALSEFESLPLIRFYPLDEDTD
jgi:DNA-binding MarR family transcriptional regulator